MKKTKKPRKAKIGKSDSNGGSWEISRQRPLDIAARLDVREAIRQGLDDVAHGRTRPAREVFSSFRQKYGVPL
jgi:hypothetical protein